MNFDVIICFETHVELKTRTKLFCDCSVSYDSPQNSEICPICTGQPGALPVLNRQAVADCVRAGLALNCHINRHSRFARKNYFYPDLPKGYQISQYELPFCENGYLEIPDENGSAYPVGIRRIHLEEDAGKLVHPGASFEKAPHSLVDYNRSSVPLLEIVGDHQRNPLRSLRQARVYLEKLRQILRYIEVSDCVIEKGQFRCDVNISLRPTGSSLFGNRTEIKNMSSFKFILEALAYEIKRQGEILRAGGEVAQETRLFDEAKKITMPMRSKEDAPDYRYFPDPDLVEIELDEAFVETIRHDLPELPDQQEKRLLEQFKMTPKEAEILTRDKSIVEFFYACVPHCTDQQRLIRWIIKELFKLLNEASQSIDAAVIKPGDFARLINLIVAGEITEKIGRTVLAEMFQSGENPESIISRKNLQAIDDPGILVALVNEIIHQNPEVVEQIRGGETKPIDYLIGQVMRKSRGKANPTTVRQLILQQIGAD